MKKAIKGVILNESLLSDINITNMFENEGCNGLGMLTIILFYLKKCYHSIGCLDEESIHLISKKANKQDHTIRRFITQWNIFQISADGKYFVYRKFRKQFKFSTEVSKRESDVISIYGNRIVEEPQEYTLNHPAEVPEKDEISSSSCNEKATKNSRRLHEDSILMEKSNSQNTDNKDVSNLKGVPLSIGKGIGKGIKLKAINTAIPTTIKDNADDDAEKYLEFFEEKILSAVQWRRSVSVSQCINLDDDDTARLFAKWMANYCISKNKIPKNDGDFFDYASNLLMLRHCTRQSFDKFCTGQHNSSVPRTDTKRGEKAVCAPKINNRGTFEQLINGRRIGLDGQELPPEAPPLYNINDRWSYIKRRYVNKKDWDMPRELRFWEEQKRKKRDTERAEQEALTDMMRMERLMNEGGVCSVDEILYSKILPRLGYASKGKMPAYRNFIKSNPTDNGNKKS